MRIIKKADTTVSNIWNEGKIRQGFFRLLTYVFVVKVEDGLLLHHVVSGELIFFDTEEEQKLSLLPCDYAPWMDELIRKHFLVKVEQSDKRTVDSLRHVLRVLETSKRISDYTILPSTNCNARCFYCYESEVKRENMSDETADKLVAFMEANRGDKPLYLEWFGGEPLLGMRQIDRICSKLKDRNIAFSSSMISNGYLFDNEIVKRAKNDWNLKQIQITLDGTEKIYNETKAYINACESPYKKVLDSIGYLLERNIHVVIRLNIGTHNCSNLRSLVDEIADRFEDKSYLSVYTHILFDDCGFSPACFNKTELVHLYENKEMLDNQINRHAENRALGKLPKLIYHCCMADSASAVVVLPSGNLGKCEHCVDSHYIGSLETGITDQQELKRFTESITYSQCAQCLMYPACIKLKLCQPGGKCSQELAQLEINGVVRNMKRHYELFLRKECTDKGDYCTN